MRAEFLPFASPDISEAEIAEVTDTLRGGWLTTGPKTRRFEEEFAAYVGMKHAVAVNSCTAALHLALEAVGVGQGDDVLTSTMTFAATGEVIRYLGANPVLVDIDPVTLNIDTARLDDAITAAKRPKAIIPVHMAGLACDMEAIASIAEGHHLQVIEDAAHTLPTRYQGQTCGPVGDVSCFSFYSTKSLATGEGGMAVTDDQALAERMRLMSLHGISHDAWKRYTAAGSWYYEILAPGFKYNMSDITASLGLVQLRRVDEFHKRRQAIARRYTEAFVGLNDYLDTPPDAPSNEVHAWHLYVIRLRLNRLRIDRKQFIEEMKRRNIGCSVHFIPLHMHPYYRETYGCKPEDFPNARMMYERIVSLPLYAKMTDDDAEAVIEAVTATCQEHGT
jgi:dTDP-4-amino-4,6-dideoxygalactose transaminase